MVNNLISKEVSGWREILAGDFDFSGKVRIFAEIISQNVKK